MPEVSTGGIVTPALSRSTQVGVSQPSASLDQAEGWDGQLPTVFPGRWL
jgi:hypothetical protein